MLGMQEGTLQKKEQEIRNSELTSLSSLVLTEGDTAIELVDTVESDDPSADPEHAAAWSEAKEKFRRAFDELTPREQEVAVLLYVKNLTLREVGLVLDVSESRVSQIHSRLKSRIRDRLERDGSLFREVA
jgi:RNA polymerase sigma factor for flagellar operon FliA